jgi:hypothetical protein
MQLSANRMSAAATRNSCARERSRLIRRARSSSWTTICPRGVWPKTFSWGDLFPRNEGSLVDRLLLTGSRQACGNGRAAEHQDATRPKRLSLI